MLAVHGAIGRAGLVRKAGKVLLDEAFLKEFARVLSHDSLAQLGRKLIEASSSHIETDTRIEQGYFRAHVLSDPGSGVQSNGRPEVALLYSGVGLDVAWKRPRSVSFGVARGNRGQNTLENTSRKASSRSTLPALRTSPARPTAP